ncbi:ClpP family protease [Bacillus sp. Marseille-P3800]|uniref:ClpP family protease n=1 Tax=Bacillus sp. Marseille-P3800 TaxID=2014782 RepID=UPI000C06A70C|nr:ATP-dependent Clp protease proteolytic subunit [Bacillus sp. Marseille-P3800]
MEQPAFDRNYMEVIQEMPNSIYEYQDYLALQERKIYFNTEVSSSIIADVVYWIHKWNEDDDKLNLTANQRKPITIYINSPGGEMISGFAAIDSIKQSKTKVITVGVGMCASMGALLLIAGHERRAYKNTVILLHDGAMALQSSSKKAKNTMDFYSRLDERVKNYVVSNSNISEDLYTEKEDEEWYIFADDGIELGLVDQIL